MELGWPRPARKRSHCWVTQPLVASRSGAADPGEAGMRNDAINLRPARNAPPEFAVTREVIGGIHERLDRLERLLEVVINKLDRR